MTNPTSWPRAILLDFYGTVVEEDHAVVGRICTAIAKASPTEATATEISSHWGREFGQSCFESAGATFRSQRELARLSLQAVLKYYEANLDSDALSQIEFEYWPRPTIYPESREVLAQCKIPICLVSNIDNADLRSALDHNDLRFDWVVTSEDCRAYKPRGEMFAKALSLLDLSAGEALHVGDSFSSDVRGARTQGIPVLWINRRRKQVPVGQDRPDYAAADLTGLLKVLRAADHRWIDPINQS